MPLRRRQQQGATHLAMASQIVTLFVSFLFEGTPYNNALLFGGGQVILR